MSVDRLRRLCELERRHHAQSRGATAPVYTIMREGDARPNVAGPVYRLVAA